MRIVLAACFIFLGTLFRPATARSDDYVRQLQNDAIKLGRAEFGHWGSDPQNYRQWGTHSNRLVPVYTFGTLDAGDQIDLRSFQDQNSPYRDELQLARIYGRTPSNTFDPTAEFCDQTNLFQIQRAALMAGRKYIFLVIFDGMDWQTTWATAIYKNQRIAYSEGRGTGLHFQDYTANGTTQFGWICTSPHNSGTKVNVNSQAVLNPGGTLFGGYSIPLGGPNPWTPGSDSLYPISKNENSNFVHAFTDSSSSATSMTAGIKTYNNGVNVDFAGNPVSTIAHLAQDQGFAVGAVSSVPISHATPAASYAHNVHRDDYQDLTRDMLGLKSVSHPDSPLPGMDVVIGGGFGETRVHDGAKPSATTSDEDNAGNNFVPGNAYLTDQDLNTIDARNGGQYVTSIRTSGANGKQQLHDDAKLAANSGKRLLGFYGNGKYMGHLPFATANGDFQPAIGRKETAEVYSEADLTENPSLSDMTAAAITVLSQNSKGFWLMVEPGDVDWANHDNNIDNSIGAVLSGDQAVKTITDWVESHSNWNESLLIVTADHGHYFVLEKPELLIESKK